MLLAGVGGGGAMVGEEGREDWADFCHGWMNNGKIDSCGSEAMERSGECLLSVSDVKIPPNKLLGTSTYVIDERWNQV